MTRVFTSVLILLCLAVLACSVQSAAIIADLPKQEYHSFVFTDDYYQRHGFAGVNHVTSAKVREWTP